MGTPLQISTGTINMLDKFNTDMRDFLRNRVVSWRGFHKDEEPPDSLTVLATPGVQISEDRIAEVKELYRGVLKGE